MIPSNYRPISCLPLAWKILTGIIAVETYIFLEKRSLLPEEQKGCRKGSRGTGDLLYIDRILLQEVKRRRKNGNGMDRLSQSIRLSSPFVDFRMSGKSRYK